MSKKKQGAQNSWLLVNARFWSVLALSVNQRVRSSSFRRWTTSVNWCVRVFSSHNQRDGQFTDEEQMTDIRRVQLHPFTGNRVLLSPTHIMAQGEALCPRVARRRLAWCSSALWQTRRGIEPEPPRVGKDEVEHVEQ